MLLNYVELVEPPVNEVILIAAVCEPYSARIIIGDEDSYYSELNPQPDAYYIDGSLSVGRIELCLEGMWNPVCQDFWTDTEASVACSQLGFSRHGEWCLI